MVLNKIPASRITVQSLIPFLHDEVNSEKPFFLLEGEVDAPRHRGVGDPKS